MSAAREEIVQELEATGESMDELVMLCSVDEVEEGQPKRVAIPDRNDVAVYKILGEIYVTDDLCTHATASLSDDGILDGHVIECSWHQGKFDVRTGAAIAPPCVQPLRTYPTVIRDNAIYVTTAALFKAP